MKKDLSKGDVVFYSDELGNYQVDVIMEDNTLWLNQKQMEQLFQTNRTSISRHINNILSSGELEESTCAIFAQVQKEGNRTITREVIYCNLDMILAVGYRVTSKIATHFRKWATGILREYVTNGYVINKTKLQKQQKQINDLKNAIDLFERGLNNQIEDLNQAKNLSKLINDYAKGLDLLDDFDHKTLDKDGLSLKPATRVNKEEFLKVIERMKSNIVNDVFAVPKDKSFESSINQIYQTNCGCDCYPSLEEKAAMLLYLIVKNHSFTDGNKRIGANCFLYFLAKNNLLYNSDGQMIIDNGALFALTLLIAESNAKEMETTKQIIISILNRNNKPLKP